MQALRDPVQLNREMQTAGLEQRQPSQTSPVNSGAGQSKPGQTESSASGVIPGAGNVIIEGNPENDVIIGPGA